MNSQQYLIEDLTEDAKATGILLSRIPEDRLTWQPHEKSMTLGRLGMHIAELPKWVISTIETDGMDFAAVKFRPNVPEKHDQIMTEFEDALAKAVVALQNVSDEALNGAWIARAGDRVIWSLSKRTLVRQTIRHIVHHRGQLSVYLRLLNVPLPKMFGPTADERS